MSKIKIAIAEDYTIVRKGIMAILSGERDFEIVAEAEHGLELLKKIAALPAPPDVCLLDIQMPEMDGYATLVALRGLYPAMRFLVLTQVEHEFVIVRMLRAGASGYMLKTSEPAELRKAIKTIRQQPFYSSKLVNGQLITLVQRGEEYTKLSLNEMDEKFLRQTCTDLSYKEIAVAMNITERNAAYYRERLFAKLGVTSRTGLALYAMRLGLIPPNAEAPAETEE